MQQLSRRVKTISAISAAAGEQRRTQHNPAYFAPVDFDALLQVQHAGSAQFLDCFRFQSKPATHTPGARAPARTAGCSCRPSPRSDGTPPGPDNCETMAGILPHSPATTKPRGSIPPASICPPAGSNGPSSNPPANHAGCSPTATPCQTGRRPPATAPHSTAGPETDAPGTSSSRIRRRSRRRGTCNHPAGRPFREGRFCWRKLRRTGADPVPVRR